MLQANVSAPSPFRSTRPDTKIPTAQLVSIRLAKNAASAKPSAQRLKPKNAIASSVTGTMPIARRMMLMIIRAATNSVGAQRRDQQVAEIARIHLLEERNREAELSAKQDVPQHHGADQHAAGAGIEARLLGEIGLQETPHQHLHGRPVDQLDQARERRAQQVPIAQHHRGDAARGETRSAARVHRAASRSRPRATSRNTSSSVSRP